MSTAAATAVIRGANGLALGGIEISRLPGRTDRLESDGERVELEEEGTYVFSIHGFDGHESVVVEPGAELFSFDDGSHRRGRIRPRQHVGRIRVRVRAGLGDGVATVTVAPRKLEEETEYRQMLDDIAEVATEAILQGFAPAALALVPESNRRPELLYQQFAFLHARLCGAGVDDIANVLHRPHQAWVDNEEHKPPGAPFRGGSRNLRALSRPGPRLRAPEDAGISSLPQRPAVTRSEETLDTEPNRFMAFAFERWRELARRVRELLLAQSTRSGPVSRGIDAAEEVLALLDRALSAPLFQNVGRLTSFPTGNQVLQRRAGYRELFRTFVLVETGARLALHWDVDDAFAATQRNIATLYEYWAFVELAKSVGRVCGDDLTVAVLEQSTDGLSLGFRRGKKSGLRWTTEARGRQLKAELYFNREFLVSAKPDSSWSRAMRPDCSLHIRPEGLSSEVGEDELAIWIHFDAKYRVEFADEQFAPPAEDDAKLAAEAEQTERLARSKREDLLKMHAYRDAIRRSAGAYVLYPGNEHRTPFTEYHEMLPGLGAFALRPGGGKTLGAAQLDEFISSVLDHVADRATQHERSRYWRTIIHKVQPSVVNSRRRLPSLAVPPSDAPVMCGYLRSTAQHAWVERNGLYNVRAGDRRGAVTPDAEVLRASDIVLYGLGQEPTLWTREGPWFVQGNAELLASGYPKPGGRTYLCCPVARRHDAPDWLGKVAFGRGALTGSLPGAPFLTTWQALLAATSE